MIIGRRRFSTYKVGKYEFKSKYEYTIAKDLEERGIKFKYESKKYPWKEKLPRAVCKDCGSKEAYADRSYTPDFFLANGVIVESKGRFTSKDRKIAAAMREVIGPDFKMMFQTDNLLRKGAKSRYSDWCMDKDIDYHIGKAIPERWLKNE